MSRSYFGYILAGESRELYIGVTSNLERRVAEHRLGLDPDSYSSRHRTMQLVYYEMTANVTSAIRREKQLKQLKRVRKIRLIEKMNPEWKDLAGMEV